MKKVILITAIISILFTSLVFGVFIHDLDQGHRNFEYIQCKQFYELANKTLGDHQEFDCELLLTEGVMGFNLFAKTSIPERGYGHRYAYQDQVEEYIKSGLGEDK